MQLVWVLEGEHAGKFHPFPDDIAAKMIDDGKAQNANTPAHQIRQPTYMTRDMVPDRTVGEFVIVGEEEEESEEPEKVAPKRKRKTAQIKEG